MFHSIWEMAESTAEQTVQELDRTYKTASDFVHAVEDTIDFDPEFHLTGVCKAQEAY
jgi:hypothetical protein